VVSEEYLFSRLKETDVFKDYSHEEWEIFLGEYYRGALSPAHREDFDKAVKALPKFIL